MLSWSRSVLTGDANPMLGIALELGRRGREVTFLTNPVFESFAKAGGIGFTAVGTESDYQFVWNPDSWRWWRLT